MCGQGSTGLGLEGRPKTGSTGTLLSLYLGFHIGDFPFEVWHS